MKAFVLTGPTASGITSLCEYLLLQDGDMLAPLVSFTTRKKLSQEVYGREYFFISQEQYLQLKVEGQVAQEIQYLNHHYGLTHSELSKFEQTRKNGLAAMGMPGVQALKGFLGEPNVISLFIYRDLNAIKDELMQRNISAAEKVQRFEMAKREMLDIGKADHVIYNIGSLNDAYHEAIHIIRQEINTREQKSLFQPGRSYKNPFGDIYEAVELARDYASGQAMAILKHPSGSLLTQPLRQFLKEMAAVS